MIQLGLHRIFCHSATPLVCIYTQSNISAELQMFEILKRQQLMIYTVSKKTSPTLSTVT